MRQFPQAVPVRESTAGAAPSKRNSRHRLPYPGRSRPWSSKGWPSRPLVEQTNARGDRGATNSRAVRESAISPSIRLFNEGPRRPALKKTKDGNGQGTEDG